MPTSRPSLALLLAPCSGGDKAVAIINSPQCASTLSPPDASARRTFSFHRPEALRAWPDAEPARCARLRQAVLKRAFEGRLVRGEPKAQLLAVESEVPQVGAGATS
jgi:hypothetical protein